MRCLITKVPLEVPQFTPHLAPMVSSYVSHLGQSKAGVKVCLMYYNMDMYIEIWGGGAELFKEAGYFCKALITTAANEGIWLFKGGVVIRVCTVTANFDCNA